MALDGGSTGGFRGLHGETYSENENHRGDTQSTYDVWDFEIISAHELAGKRYRIAVVNERRFTEAVVDTEGADGLDDQLRKSIPVGTVKRVVLSDVKLKSLYSPTDYEVKRLKKSNGVIANLSHVRSCR